MPPALARLGEREVLFVLAFAVIETGGKQYKVKEGDVILLRNLERRRGGDGYL